MRISIGYGLVLASFCALAACGEEAGGQGTDGTSTTVEREHNVRVVELKATNLRESVVLSGRVVPVQATDLSSEEFGVVRRIIAAKGDVVRRGSPLVELNRDLLEAEMKAAEAAKELRQYNAERTKTLYDEDSASAQEALLEQTALEQAIQLYEVARLRYERALIKAPFDGIVSQRYVEVGQFVSPGAAVVRVVDPFTVELEGWVTERQVAWIRTGAPASVSIDGSDVAFLSSVQWVGVEADPATGKFPVELRIPNAELAIRPGVVARGRVEKRLHQNAMVIPRDAIVTTAEGTVVFVEVAGRAEARVVKLGADQGLMVICESGLDAGDRVIVRGQRQLSPGAAVRVQEISERRDGWLPTDPIEIKEDDDFEFESSATALPLESNP